LHDFLIVVLYSIFNLPEIMIFGIENNIAKSMSELGILILKDLDISGSSRGQSCKDHEYGSLEDQRNLRVECWPMDHVRT
jgi:hypothetical protein